MQLPQPPNPVLKPPTTSGVNRTSFNARCHPTGRGTIDKDGTRTPAEKEQLEFDYYLPSTMRSPNLIANFVSSLAKEGPRGRRFQLINLKAEAGEGTAQNVPVELIDIVFFTVSLLQVRGKISSFFFFCD